MFPINSQNILRFLNGYFSYAFKQMEFHPVRIVDQDAFFAERLCDPAAIF